MSSDRRPINKFYMNEENNSNNDCLRMLSQILMQNQTNNICNYDLNNFINENNPLNDIKTVNFNSNNNTVNFNNNNNLVNCNSYNKTVNFNSNNLSNINNNFNLNENLKNLPEFINSLNLISEIINLQQQNRFQYDLIQEVLNNKYKNNIIINNLLINLLSNSGIYGNGDIEKNEDETTKNSSRYSDDPNKNHPGNLNSTTNPIVLENETTQAKNANGNQFNIFNFLLSILFYFGSFWSL